MADHFSMSRQVHQAKTKGWSFTIYEEEWNCGFHQEMAHLIDCVQNDKQPLVTGYDARAVMEVIFAAYESQTGSAFCHGCGTTHRPVAEINN